MISWDAFEFGGKRYDLSHLHPFEWTFIQPAKAEQPERRYEVQVAFGLHCFTRSQEPSEKNGPLCYSDSREVRSFDFVRHAHSRHLPDLIKRLHTVQCFHTQHGTFFTIKKVDAETGEGDYEVYFEASRGKRGRINLFVISAYVRDRDHSNRPRKEKIGIFAILRNVGAGKNVKRPPK